MQTDSLTVHSLRKMGFQVHINHLRYIGNPKKKHNLASYHHIRSENKQNLIKPKGGLTVMEILDAANKPIYTVQAKCRIDEAFVRKEGLKFCLQRVHDLMHSTP